MTAYLTRISLYTHLITNLTKILNQLRIILMQQHIEKRIMQAEKK